MANYFEGKYYKHQKDGNTICFIAGSANGQSFVQVITNERVWQHDSLAGFQADETGLRVNIPGIRGRVRYGPLTPLQSDIMGPFRWLPMQCSHQVFSMGHTLTGGFVLDGQPMPLTGGIGYIEGDRGRSFPKQYLWLHCNNFAAPCSIMASVAHIPFGGFSFMGCICAIVWQGREYRLATYRGVQICAAAQDRLVLAQGPYRLVVQLLPSTSHPLKAPRQGKMIDTIHESNCTQGRFRFWEHGKLLFDLKSSQVSCECNLQKPMD